MNYKLLITLLIFPAVCMLIYSCNAQQDLLSPPDVASVDAVEMFYPADGEIVTKAFFSCSDVNVEGTQSEDYRAQLSQIADFSEVEIEIESDNNEVLYCDKLYEGSWYIRASARIDEGEWGDWSSAVAFTAESLINADDIVLMRVNDDEMKVDWPEVEGCNEYRIAWGSTAVYADMIQETRTGLSETYIWLSRDAAGWDSIYIRVKNNGDGIMTSPIYFTNGWEIWAPLDEGIELDTTPLFKWASVEGAVGYELQFANSTAALESSTVRTVSSPEYQVAAGDAFSVGDNISWRVRALTGEGRCAQWSRTAVFEVKSAPGIGDKYAGGYVFYLNSGNGLSCCLEDLSFYNGEPRSYYIWGNPTVDIPGGESASDGAGNSLDIVTELGDYNNGVYAAKACVDYEGYGYTDWYLPAFSQLTSIQTAVGDNGTFSGESFWSSTEYSESAAQSVRIPGTDTYLTTKNTGRRVRPVRSFSY